MLLNLLNAQALNKSKLEKKYYMIFFLLIFDEIFFNIILKSANVKVTQNTFFPK